MKESDLSFSLRVRRHGKDSLWLKSTDDKQVEALDFKKQKETGWMVHADKVAIAVVKWDGQPV